MKQIFCTVHLGFPNTLIKKYTYMGQEVFLTLYDPGGDQRVLFTVRSLVIFLLRYLCPMDGRKLYSIPVLLTLHGTCPGFLKNATSGRVIPLAGRTMKKCNWICGVFLGLLDRRCWFNRNIRFCQEVRRDFQEDRILRDLRRWGLYRVLQEGGKGG